MVSIFRLKNIFSLIPTNKQTKCSNYHTKFIIFAIKHLECQYLIGLKTEK